MKVRVSSEQAPHLVDVKLSRSNLRKLYQQLNEGREGGLARRLENGTLLYVTAEEDSEHYADRKAA